MRNFIDNKASTHVATRNASKRCSISHLLLYHPYIITKVYIKVVFINKTTLSISRRYYIVLYDGHTPSESTTARRHDINHGIDHVRCRATVLIKLCVLGDYLQSRQNWWSHLRLRPLTSVRHPRQYLSKCKTSSIATLSYILHNFLLLRRSRVHRL
jgi:hypothetical protein